MINHLIMSLTHQANNNNNNICFERDITSHGNNNILNFITEDNSPGSLDVGQFGYVCDSVTSVLESFSDIQGIKSEQQPMSSQSDASHIHRSDEKIFDQHIPMNLNRSVKVTSGFKVEIVPGDEVLDQDAFTGRKGRRRGRRQDSTSFRGHMEFQTSMSSRNSFLVEEFNFIWIYFYMFKCFDFFISNIFFRYYFIIINI